MRKPSLFAAVSVCLSLASRPGALVAEPTPPLAPEIPAQFTRPTDAADYDRREVMIAMRDGVKLHTVVLVPRGAHRLPIILTRTPYNASKRTERAVSNRLAATLSPADDQFSDCSFIRAYQDVRGKY